MSDHENENSTPDVRRVSSRDRKQEISSGGLFDALPPTPPAGTPPPPPPDDLPEASADDPGDDDEHARFKPPQPAAPDPELGTAEDMDDAVDDEDSALLMQEMLDAVAAEAAETGEQLKVFESIRSYQPEPEDEPPAETPVADDADALIDELDSQTITPVAREDDDLDALIDQVEEDTSKLRAITDAQIAAAEAAERARFKAPVDRFPPLPEEEVAALTSRPALREPPKTRAERRSAAEKTREERIREHAETTLPPIREPGGCLRPQNILTIGLLGISVLIIGYFAFIWQNPYSAINPLAPLTPPPIVITATFTPSLTFTPAPTETPTPTLTPSPVPTDTPVPTPTSEGGGVLAPERIRFVVQSNRTLYLTNPDSRGACNWSSIGGTVVDLEGDAVRGYRVQLIGDDVDETLETGSSPGFGPGGFEYQVAREAVERSFTAQLFDPSGTPVSDLFRFNTSTRCDWNIAVLRFVEIPQEGS